VCVRRKSKKPKNKTDSPCPKINYGMRERTEFRKGWFRKEERTEYGEGEEPLPGCHVG